MERFGIGSSRFPLPISAENRNMGRRKSFEKPKATGGFLFQFAAQYIICKAPARDRNHHPRLPQILSAEARNLSPGPNAFYTSVTTRITFVHPPLFDTRAPLFPFSRRSHPLEPSNHRLEAPNLFSTREPADWSCVSNQTVLSVPLFFSSCWRESVTKMTGWFGAFNFCRFFYRVICAFVSR